MTDPVRRRRPLRDRPAFYWTIICFTITVIGGLMLLGKINHESKIRTEKINHESAVRTQQLQDVICGVYVPIGNAHLPARISPIGKTIVVATRHGALELHCPGIH